MFHLIGFIIFGFIVGLIARALTPGREHMGFWVTSILGILGSSLAGWAGRGFGWYGPDDGAGFIMSTFGAIVVLTIYHFVMRGHSGSALSSKSDHSSRAA